MREEWKAMTPGERQRIFLDRWARGEGAEFASDAAREAYGYRANLVRDAVLLDKTPDRVPVIPRPAFGAPKLYGHSARAAMYDPHIAGQSFLDFTLEFQPDTASGPPGLGYGPPLEVLDYRLYQWPGHGIREELSFQYVEREYMKPEEYDHFIGDLTDFWLRVWLPRTHGALAPLAELPPIYGTMELPMSTPWLTALGAPPMQEALKALTDAGKLCYEWIQALRPYIGRIRAAGFPMGYGGFSKAPFDVLSDTFRGTLALMTDLFRRPEKVLAAAEMLIPHMIRLGAGAARASNNPFILIPLHKGADGFLSPQQFETFYWPSLKAVLLGLIDEGCVPFPFAEGSYTQRLEHLTELPRGQVTWLLDRTDMARAREVLGGHSCFSGGFPISVLLTGTVEQVECETRKLLDAAAGEGGYMLSPGCSLDDVNVENLRAFMRTGMEYGRYA